MHMKHIIHENVQDFLFVGCNLSGVQNFCQLHEKEQTAVNATCCDCTLSVVQVSSGTTGGKNLRGFFLGWPTSGENFGIAP